MENIIVGFLIGIFTLAIVFRVLAWSAERKLLRLLKQVEDRIEASRIYLKIETHTNGTLIAYNKNTDEFVAQGANFEELADAFRARYPEKTGVMDQDDYLKWTKP